MFRSDGKASGHHPTSDTGYVTAETAVVLPVLALLLAVALWAIAVAAAHVRVVDAARDGARAAARGETDDAVVAAVEAAAPPGADVDVRRAGGSVTVIVRARIGPATGVAGPLGAIPAPEVAATAVARSEDAP